MTSVFGMNATTLTGESNSVLSIGIEFAYICKQTLTCLRLDVAHARYSSYKRCHHWSHACHRIQSGKHTEILDLREGQNTWIGTASFSAVAERSPPFLSLNRGGAPAFPRLPNSSNPSCTFVGASLMPIVAVLYNPRTVTILACQSFWEGLQ